jgi:glutamyl/glutaminyl-tRNA synthetase
MQITDVIRGDDHLSNTPKQLLALGALGATPPRYAHLPLLHGPDGKKLSKRHGAASVGELRDAGYLAAAVRNYLALLGWGDTDDETILATDELVARFDIRRVKRSAAIFDERKLRWINGRTLRGLPADRFADAVARFTGRELDERLRAGCAIAQEKAQTLAEVWPLIRFLFEEPVDDERAWRKTMKGEAFTALAAARGVLATAEPFDVATLEAQLAELVERLGLKPGRVFQPIRVAITGTTVSPGIFESLAALGRDRSLTRIDAALARLEAPEPSATDG